MEIENAILFNQSFVLQRRFDDKMAVSEEYVLIGVGSDLELAITYGTVSFEEPTLSLLRTCPKPPISISFVHTSEF